MPIQLSFFLSFFFGGRGEPYLEGASDDPLPRQGLGLDADPLRGVGLEDLAVAVPDQALRLVQLGGDAAQGDGVPLEDQLVGEGLDLKAGHLVQGGICEQCACTIRAQVFGTYM